MLKYGIERVTNGESKVTVWSDAERAKREAEALGARLRPGEYAVLFQIECDDATGEVASSLRRVVRTWRGGQ